MHLRVLIALSGLLVFCAGADAQRPATSRPQTYPQLIATRYPAGTPLPAGVKRPAPSYDFIPRAGLPAGARITSAARTAHGDVWVITDKGSFRYADGRYRPLEPARLLQLHATLV